MDMTGALINYICLGIFLPLLSLSAQTRGLTPAVTPHGRIVQSYVDAFNSGDTSQMRSFFLATTQPEALIDRPVGMRLQRYRLAKADLLSLRVVAMNEADSSRIILRANTGKGADVTLTFEFAPVSPYLITQVRLDLGQPGDTGPPVHREEAMDSIRGYLQSAADADKFSG